MVPTDFHVNYTRVYWDEPNVVTTQNGEKLVRTNSTHQPGMTFELGISPVTYFVHGIDGGIVTECSFDILVEGKIMKCLTRNSSRCKH